MNSRVQIIADTKIPFLKGVLEPYADIQYLNPPEITREKIREKDALIIRTRTNCNSDLLDGTEIKFIATATIGYDHIDTSYCEKNNIEWVNAPGCNSSSVMQYISSALLTIAFKKNLSLSDLTIGIVGVGNVGSKVANISKIFGMKVLLNDPPRMRKEGRNGFVDLNSIIEQSDIITFHVPLIKSGEDKTYHMADEIFFNKFKSKKIIINTSRGQVLETKALKDSLKKKMVNAAILDVWENEPDIDKELLEMTDIATPHIAGYSADGKANGTSVCVQKISSFFNFGIREDWYPEKLPSPENSNEVFVDCINKSVQEIIHQVVSASYNIMKDDNTLRNSVETFEKQRSKYPVRREFPFYKLKLVNCNNTIKHKLEELGFQIT